jgi:hypothetical protein
MNFSETNKVEKEIGFVSDSRKAGRAARAEVEKKFSKLFKNTTPTVRSKFTNVNGIPHKTVNGKLVPLTSLK